VATSRSAYDQAKLRFVYACGAIAAGLAIAGSLDRSTGGVIVLLGWISGVVTLHRLGRAGSDRAPATELAKKLDVAAEHDDADVPSEPR